MKAKNNITHPLTMIAIGFLLLFSTLITSCAEKNKKAEDNTAAISQENLKTTTIPIEGMTCGACVSRVKKTISTMEGVNKVEVSLEKRNVTVSYNDKIVLPDSMVKVFNELGYTAGTPK
ncbi:MAG: heavy metal-associated domain-containing protein [Bacteroidota bacterium]|nr:heavy metal-associated domain-containing protein [Bacteroidota bacterium]